MHCGVSASGREFLFEDEDRGPLERVEHFIRRLEAHRQQRGEDAASPSSPSSPHTDFWRQMSPQLSYIDGSSISSVGPSMDRPRLPSSSEHSREFEAPPRAPHSLDPLDWKHEPPERGGFPPLPSLTPLARHASDSLCSRRPLSCGGLPGNLSIPDTLELPRLAEPPKKYFAQGVLKSSRDALENDSFPQTAVVKMQKGGDKVKTNIQKRLSFGDTLDLQTTIYTPAGDTESINGRTGKFEEVLTNGSTNSLERTLCEEEIALSSDHCPPLVRRKSLDSHNQYSYYMDKDLRYYFQHPWLRLIVAYLVIFCNFLLFAEDPVSHSHTGKRQTFNNLSFSSQNCKSSFVS